MAVGTIQLDQLPTHFVLFEQNSEYWEVLGCSSLVS